MKIKKKTSIMMLAASTAAIVGVAAVSFAAWNGINGAPATASAATGTVYAFGFQEENPVISFNKSLVPYDQEEKTFDASVSATTISAALPAYSVYAEDYTFTVTTASNTLAGSTIYALIGTEATVSIEGWSTSDKGDWKEVKADGAAGEKAAFRVSNTEVGDKAAGTHYIHLLLVSENRADEGKTGAFALNVTLSTTPANE